MNSAQRERGNIALIIVFVVLLLALLGGGYFLYQQTKVSKSASVPATQQATSSAVPLPSPTVVIQNPVESTSSQNYQNPFDTTQNPFDNLQ